MEMCASREEKTMRRIRHILCFLLIPILVFSAGLSASHAQAPQQQQQQQQQFRALLQRTEALEREVEQLREEIERLKRESGEIGEQSPDSGQTNRDPRSANVQDEQSSIPQDVPLASDLYDTGASKIAFVIDASGSMIGKFKWLKAEIGARIDRMTPDQSFVIVAFQEGKAIQMGKGWFRANDANKKRAALFLGRLDVKPESVPLAAVEIALAAAPDEIWFVTDGAFPKGDDDARKILEMNQHNIPLHTFSTVAVNETWRLLRYLSNETGGSFVQFSVEQP
jgi:hypothetical protein